MCLQIILGATQPLPLSEYAPQCEDKYDGLITVSPGCKATTPEEKKTFPTRTLYWIKPRDWGCACKLRLNYPDAPAICRAIADFLERSLEYVPDLQLYATDDECNWIAPERIGQLCPNDLRTWVTQFREGEFFQVIPDPNL